jgi:hypothetical protein
MIFRKRCIAAPAALAAGLLVLSAAGPAAAASSEKFNGFGGTILAAQDLAEFAASTEGFSASECTLTSLNFLNDEYVVTITCTN